MSGCKEVAVVMALVAIILASIIGSVTVAAGPSTGVTLIN